MDDWGYRGEYQDQSTWWVVEIKRPGSSVWEWASEADTPVEADAIRNEFLDLDPELVTRKRKIKGLGE